MNAHIRASIAVAVVVAAAAAAAPSVLGAQIPRPHPASDPVAVALYERNIRVTGSGPVPEFHHSIQEMTFGGGPPIRTELYTAAPDKVFMRNTMGGTLILEFGYDGTSGWTSSPATGVVRITGPQLEAMRASVTNVASVSVDSSVRLIALGRQTLDDEPVDGIMVVRATGDTVEAYYAVSTGLLAGARPRGTAGGMPDSTVMLLRDYKEIGGRMMHTTMILRLPGMESVSRTIHVDHDRIPPERFRQP